MEVLPDEICLSIPLGWRDYRNLILVCERFHRVFGSEIIRRKAQAVDTVKKLNKKKALIDIFHDSHDDFVLNESASRILSKINIKNFIYREKLFELGMRIQREMFLNLDQENVDDFFVKIKTLYLRKDEFRPKFTPWLTKLLNGSFDNIISGKQDVFFSKIGLENSRNFAIVFGLKDLVVKHPIPHRKLSGEIQDLATRLFQDDLSFLIKYHLLNETTYFELSLESKDSIGRFWSFSNVQWEKLIIPSMKRSPRVFNMIKRHLELMSEKAEDSDEPFSIILPNDTSSEITDQLKDFLFCKTDLDGRYLTKTRRNEQAIREELALWVFKLTRSSQIVELDTEEHCWGFHLFRGNEEEYLSVYPGIEAVTSQYGYLFLSWILAGINCGVNFHSSWKGIVDDSRLSFEREKHLISHWVRINFEIDPLRKLLRIPGIKDKLNRRVLKEIIIYSNLAELMDRLTF